MCDSQINNNIIVELSDDSYDIEKVINNKDFYADIDEMAIGDINFECK